MRKTGIWAIARSGHLRSNEKKAEKETKAASSCKLPFDSITMISWAMCLF
jgi:hypothetical protein